MAMAAPGVRAARAKAAIVGGFVADAATMPLHWIYDTAKIEDLLSSKKREVPEFFEPASCPFYQYETGQLSPYGDEILPLLRYVGRTGEFDPAGFADESLAFLKEYKGRLNHVSKLFVEAREQGKSAAEAAVDDSQAHGIIKVPILVARYAGHPDLMRKVEEAVRVHQKNDVSVGASLAVAKILERVVLGSSVQDAVSWAETEEAGLGEREREYIKQARIKSFTNPAASIKDFGWSCALPGAFLSAIYTAFHASSYADAIRTSTLAGGDNCSRNIVVGALLGAAGGLDAVPEDWKAKTRSMGEVNELADAIVSHIQ